MFNIVYHLWAQTVKNIKYIFLIFSVSYLMALYTQFEGKTKFVINNVIVVCRRCGPYMWLDRDAAGVG